MKARPRLVLWLFVLLAVPAGVITAQKLAGPAASASAPASASRPASRLAALTPGDHTLHLEVDGRDRTYHVHVPPKYDAAKPTPVVLNFHGAWANAAAQAVFTGMNKKADSAGFIVVYPNGTGTNETTLFFKAFSRGGPLAGRGVDDVKFVAKLLDDLAGMANVDKKRVYATGMSNGAMMCQRLAAELSDRIAAIAPVSGTLCVENPKPQRPVPVIEFHGTADELVPFDGPTKVSEKLLNIKSVDETVKTWAKLDGCPDKPQATDLPDTAKDGTTVKKLVYGPGKDDAEVVLYVIDGGGHTWPGRDPLLKSLGKYTKNISANDLIWEFFEKHPMK